MAAGSRSAAVAERLVAASPGVGVGASNWPQSPTLTGDPKALGLALAALHAQGIEGKELRVTYAFHSEQMADLARELTGALRGLEPREPKMKLISTVTGRAAPPLDARY